VSIHISSLAELFNALPLPSGKSLRWLLDQGVAFDTLYKVKSGWVIFDDRGSFDLDPAMTGDPVMIMQATDADAADAVIDLVAWSARDHKVATWWRLLLVMLVSVSTRRAGSVVTPFEFMQVPSIG
jgi:hypothetical protein